MKISVIIPTMNEESRLPRALASIPPGTEVIVADGGSSDRTVEIAHNHGAQVVESQPGRGIQMNRGAVSATGEVLLFLHADCELGPGAQEAVSNALGDGRIVAGCFRMRISPPTWGYRLVGFGSNFRACVLNLPYGDQAIFVRRSTFEAVGGYPETPIMEDVILVRRLRRMGKLTCVKETVKTGSRHWQQLGPVLTTLLNWVAVALFFLGVSPARLAPVYYRLRRGKTGEKRGQVPFCQCEQTPKTDQSPRRRSS
jgi:rSAM/selenodomain-associated transferase 2